MTSPAGTIDGSSTTTIDAAARRMPMFSAAPRPRAALVRTTSCDARVIGGATPSATMTTCVSAGSVASRAARDRPVSLASADASRTTVAKPVGGSSRRLGTASLRPYRISPSTSTLGGLAGSRRYARPLSTTRQPASSISSRSRSAVCQSRSARAAERRLAASSTDAGTLEPI